MRVLLTSHYGPGTIGGTQTWVQTVADDLWRRDHEVSLWWLEGGGCGDLATYDLAIVSQNSTFDAALEVADKVIFVSHGILELEAPPAWADAYVAVSEEVTEKWGAIVLGYVKMVEGGQDLTIMRQPIDLDFWRPLQTVGPVDVLRVSYYGGMDWLPGLCAEMGLTFEHIRDEPNRGALREWYNCAGVVIASGRSALEAMACGRPVIVADERGYNGGALMANGNMRAAAETNYSGRGGNVATSGLMEWSINYARADDTRGKSARGYIEDRHDARKIVDQLLELV